MRKTLFSFGLMVLSSALAAPANATVYDYFELTFTQVGTPGNGCCGPFDVTALLKTTPNGNNFDVVGISGTVTQNGTPFAITGLIPAPNDPLVDFGFDNIIFSTGGSAPFSLDSGGIGFFATDPSYYPETSSSPVNMNGIYTSSLSAFNIWGNGGASGTLGTTASYDVNTDFNGTYSITETPLPQAWTMMLIGLAGLGFVGYRKKSAILTAA
jgi:hypothetical protein